ncbi:MAG: RpiB/LacA/LacB family sugar-phosphate isomerase [Candidatus Paceibacteria bacterium]
MDKVFIGSDHAGFELKQKLIDYLSNNSYEFEDVGPKDYDETDDYPDYALPLAQKVAAEDARGILLCGNGIGVCIAANKVEGARAGTAANEWMAKTMREDDNTNILCLPARNLNEQQAVEITETWLNTDFSEAKRHKRRLNKIHNFEQQ